MLATPLCTALRLPFVISPFLFCRSEPILLPNRCSSFTFSSLRSSSRFSSSFIADKPAGVAAHPSPSILAIILVAMASPAGCPSGRLGNKNLIIGFIFFAICSISPARCPISKIPVHRAMTPSMVMHRLTASFAESRAPWVTWLMVPWKAPHRIPTRIINAHI